MISDQDRQRPIDYLRGIRQQYPDAWIQVENLRRARGKDLPAWPHWCYLPLAGAYAIVSGGGDNKVSPEDLPRVGIIAALAAWRETQGLYEYDETLLDALWQTPIEGDIPSEILRRLPEWCVYVLTPGRRLEGLPLHGFWAHLEWDANDGHEELRFVLVREYGLTPVPLHLAGDLRSSIASTREYTERQILEHSAPGQPVDYQPALWADYGSVVEPLVSVLLYLCSAGSEIETREGSPHPRRPPRRYPQAPTTWLVGHRIGAAVRAYQMRTLEQRPEPEGHHASPRPHIRRAHWHTYRVGPGRERAELRWLHPVLVAGDRGDIVPTVHQVSPRLLRPEDATALRMMDGKKDLGGDGETSVDDGEQGPGETD